MVEYAKVGRMIKLDTCKENPYEDGYGDKIPTQYKVILRGEKRERNVYAICHSNVASFYVKVNGRKLFIQEI